MNPLKPSQACLLFVPPFNLVPDLEDAATTLWRTEAQVPGSPRGKRFGKVRVRAHFSSSVPTFHLRVSSEAKYLLASTQDASRIFISGSNRTALRILFHAFTTQCSFCPLLPTHQRRLAPGVQPAIASCLTRVCAIDNTVIVISV